MICQTDTLKSSVASEEKSGANPDQKPNEPPPNATGSSGAGQRKRDWKLYRRIHLTRSRSYERKYRELHRERRRANERARYHRTKILKGGRQIFSPGEMEIRIRVLKRRHKTQNNAYERSRAATDPCFAMARSIRATIRCALKRARAGKAYDMKTLLGCSLSALVTHIEAQFEPWMNWENRGSKWHLDDTVPLMAFNLADPEEQRWACDYRNLRPLERFANQSKSDTLPHPLPAWLPLHIAARIKQRQPGFRSLSGA